jgi:hypothetical protein
MNLVYDRTAQDVETARTQRGTTLTPLKGCYNASDMNRVAAAVTEIAAELNSAGYTVTVNPRTYAESDIIRRSDFAAYLTDVQTLRDAIAVRASTPELPAADAKLDFVGANNIEKILADLDELLGWMKYSQKYCGTFAAGQTILPRKG